MREFPEIVIGRYFDLLIILIFIISFIDAGRRIAKLEMWISINPPKWLRRIAFLPLEGKISIEGMISQIFTFFLGLSALSYWLGFNIFAPLGNFRDIFLYIAALPILGIPISAFVYTIVKALKKLFRR